MIESVMSAGSAAVQIFCFNAHCDETSGPVDEARDGAGEMAGGVACPYPHSDARLHALGIGAPMLVVQILVLLLAARGG